MSHTFMCPCTVFAGKYIFRDAYVLEKRGLGATKKKRAV